MIGFPNAKINFGLRVRRKRSDAYHDIETLLFPVGLCDVLEIMESKTGKTTLRCTGLSIDLSPTEFVQASNPAAPIQNLVIRVYELLKKDFDLPPVYIHLHKAIPTGAGLGGGSSDCAFTLKMLDQLFKLGLSYEQQIDYVSQLGSDCAFFLENKPALASGRGEMLQAVTLDLKAYHICIVKPNIHIHTGQAYSWIKPSEPNNSLQNIITKQVSDWKHLLLNDFETAVFKRYPEIKAMKEKFYLSGAVYAAMSGSGSAVFGIFEHEPDAIDLPKGYFKWKGELLQHKPTLAHCVLKTLP